MLNYLIRRVLIAGLTLLLITLALFVLIRSMPGSPLTMAMAQMDPSRRVSKEDFERLKKSYGLDKSIPEAYASWLGGLVRGDLGRSISRKQPVLRLIGERIGPTLLLSVTSIVL